MGIIAVFGGTFNPIHSGHNEIIQHLSKMPQVDQIILIPTNVPPHKELNNLASATDRFNMCEIIASDYENVVVSDIELSRNSKSYTIDTVLTLKKEYPDSELAITIGGDMLVTFNLWKDYKDIIKLCSIITFNRGGISKEDYDYSAGQLKSLGAKIIDMDANITEISSTQIRDDIKNNIDTVFVDKRVADYIRNNNLFGVNNEV